MKFVTLLTSLLISGAVIADCTLKNLKVHEFVDVIDSQTNEKSRSITIGNLEREIFLSFEKLTPEQQKSLLSFKSSDKPFDLKVTTYVCSELNSKVFMVPAFYVDSISRSSGLYDCTECLSFRNAPLLFDIPSFKELQKITTDVNLSSAESKALVLELVPILEALPRKKRTANSVLFSVLLLKRLGDYGADRLTGEQLMQMADMLKGKLSKYDINTFKSAVRQIDYVDIKKLSDGQTQLTYYGKNGRDMVMSKNDIDGTSEEKAQVQKYFESFIMKHGAVLLVSEGGRKSNLPSFEVDIAGLDGKGDFPVIGRMQVQIKKLNIQKSSEAPLVVGVKVSKGFLGVNHNIKVDY